MLIRWYSDVCYGDTVGLEITPAASTPDEWTETGGFFEAPANAVEALVRLDVWKVEAGGALSAHFDNVDFGEVLFRDDFESGTLDTWSFTVP